MAKFYLKIAQAALPPPSKKRAKILKVMIVVKNIDGALLKNVHEFSYGNENHEVSLLSFISSFIKYSDSFVGAAANTAVITWDAVHLQYWKDITFFLIF